MPQQWGPSWPIAGYDNSDTSELDPVRLAREMERNGAVNKIGNLTLLTGALNSSVSNGPYSVKMPAVRAHSSLALNRELNAYDQWDETTIAERGAGLFQTARQIWQAPDRPEGVDQVPSVSTSGAGRRVGLPPDGMSCRFNYLGKDYAGRIESGSITVDGIDGKFNSFSAASWAVTSTSRNGWHDWYLSENGGWTLADDWRKRGEA